MAGKKESRSIREVFGLNVRLERTRLGLTQEALGAMVGSDQAFVSLVERGAVAASLDTVEKLAKALKVRPADLLDETLGRPSKAG